MSTDIVISQTLDLDTGQDTLDLGPNFVFNPVQKTQPLPVNDIRCEESSPAFNVLDKGQLHLVDPASDDQATLAKDVYHSPYEEPKPVVIHDGPHLPDPTAGLHDRSIRGGDDGEEIGGHENDTEHKEDYENCD